MAYQTENTFEKRVARMEAALDHAEGDRVPIAPRVGIPYAQAGGVSMHEALRDFRLLEDGLRRYLARYETDLYWAPAGYPIPALEILGTRSIRWPGASCGIPRDQSFQMPDLPCMSREEYPELIRDPGRFFLTKVWPRKHAKLKGLSKLSFDSVVEFGHFASMAAFADPEAREALLTLMAAGDEVVRWGEATAALTEAAREMEAPPGVISGQGAPYDMLADNLRGFLNLPMDLLEAPEQVEAAVEVMTGFALEGVAALKEMGLKYCFTPLHGGTDDFMSGETYRRYYWPSLRTVLQAVIDAGIVPYIFFEGKYDTRLELLRDELPKGRILAMFEQVDLPRAKRILGDTVCLCGNLPAALLAYGRPEEIVDETKKMLDACAPGGGFVMDCSAEMDHYDERNMDAWFETTLTYGRYR